MLEKFSLLFLVVREVVGLDRVIGVEADLLVENIRLLGVLICELELLTFDSIEEWKFSSFEI